MKEEKLKKAGGRSFIGASTHLASDVRKEERGGGTVVLPCNPNVRGADDKGVHKTRRCGVTVPVEARDLNAAQCRAACQRGADAVERFCRLIPEPRIRSACWGAAAAVETPIGLKVCTSFCDAFF